MAGYYDLHLTQGARYKRTFRWVVNSAPRDLSGYQWRSQIRKMETPSSPLILDLTQYFSLSTDQLSLNLYVPSTAVTSLAMKEGVDAYWDIFIWPGTDPGAAFPFLQGLVSYESATTDMS